MSHRPLAVLGVAVVALALAAPAVAVRVQVRVEGATTTIFGATEPRLAPVTGKFSPPAGEPVRLSAPTPLGALERASRRGEFYYRLEAFSFGPYVAQIGRHAGTETTGWVYKVNGVSPPVGADAYELEEGDRVLWYFARFGATGGPRTLRLSPVGVMVVECYPKPCAEPVRTCYAAFAEDDNGRVARVRTVVFRLDGRRIASRSGRICPRGHWHTLRVGKRGFVRSQVVSNRTVSGVGGGAVLTGRAG